MKQGLGITRIYQLVRVGAGEFVFPTGGRSRYEDGRTLQVAESDRGVAGRIALGWVGDSRRHGNWPVSYRRRGRRSRHLRVCALEIRSFLTATSQCLYLLHLLWKSAE